MRYVQRFPPDSCFELIPARTSDYGEEVGGFLSVGGGVGTLVQDQPG